MLRSSFLTGPQNAGPPLWHENGVGHRQIRGRVAVEHELGLDHPLGHRRGRFPWPPAKNSVNACATRAEIVLPDAFACSRTRATNAMGSLTVNTVVCLRHARPPALGCPLGIPARLPQRAAEPLRQGRCGLGHRHPRLEQFGGCIDTPGVLPGASTITTRHDI